MKKPLQRGLLLLFALYLFAIGGVAGYVVVQIEQAAHHVYAPVQRLPSTVTVETATHSVPQAPSAARTYLLLGIDRREGDVQDVGRTDVILLAILNERTQTITLASIPRDTYVEIAGQGQRDKINHAFQHGVATTIATVETLTGVPVDHYVLFDFASFRAAVDAIGGIEVPLDPAVAASLQLPVGSQPLNGEQALRFARFRSDERGDVGRNDRQQLVLQAFLRKSQQLRSPLAVKRLLDAAGQEVRTDLTLAQMADLLLTQARTFSAATIQTQRLLGYGQLMGDPPLWYYVVDEAARESFAQALRTAHF